MEEQTFGTWLRLKRKALDLTRESLADRVGCSAATIRKIEAEERRPSAQIVERLAEVFQIPPDERTTFLRFARGDWKAKPESGIEGSPWHAPSTRSNIPATTNSLIGREKEIADLCGYLQRPDIRLVTLSGPPGIGKTRLSIEAARSLLPDFPDGVFFIALASLDDPNSIASAIIQALGYMESGEDAPKDQLKEGIGQKRILIVLDNCEHLIEAVASLAGELLSACSHLKMLATSRESLRIPGEWLYPIPAFDVPAERDTINLDNASNFPALVLFVERARAVRPDFKLSAENIQTIVAICAHLDGLPLVIELIAARMRLISPQALLERLSARFVLTADGMRASSERQKTLRNAIDWSYNMLSAEEQKLFVCLSVFAGGFRLADAEAIFGHTVTEKSVPELLVLLLDKSLIRMVVSESSEDRYEMLVTIREYARERLRQLGEETKISNWYLAYFGELARQARPYLRSTDQLEWLDRLDMEYDNIRAALSWAQASGSIVTGLNLATDLEMFWIYRAYLREPCLALENLLAASPPTDQLHTLSRGHLVAGTLQMFLGNYDAAQSHAKECERLCLQLGSTYKADLADARNLIVYTGAEFINDPVRSRHALEQNLKLFREADEQWMIAHTLYNIGYTLQEIRDFIGARQSFEQSLDLFRDCGDHFRVAHLNACLAGIAFEEDKYAEARLRLEDAISFRRQVRFNIQMEIDLYMLATIAIREGDKARAKAWFSECLLFIQQIGVNSLLVECLIGLAGIAATEKHFKRAAQIVGTVEMQVETRQFPLASANRSELNWLTTILQEELGNAEFEALTTTGRAMTMEQAIAYALEDEYD
jgi:predicted ATPase/transcriptional regulator with XRE-family HTH domain